MAKYCERPGCGHDEGDHLPENQGGCFAKYQATGHRCVCPAFVDSADTLGITDETKLAPLPPLRRSSTPPPLRVVAAGDVAPGAPSESLDDTLKHEVVRRRVFNPRPTAPHDAEEGFLANVASVAIEGEKPSDSNRAQGHVLIDPGMKIAIAGKPREMTELHAAANAIIAETNADDLATGVYEMRQKIRTQGTTINELRAELEGVRGTLSLLQRERERLARPPVSNVNVKIDVQGDVHPAALAVALHNAAEEVLEKLKARA